MSTTPPIITTTFASGVPDHWIGWADTAPNFSREVACASGIAKAADDALFEVMRKAYPIGAPVRMYHRRAGMTYIATGKVTGYRRGAEVVVKNDASGKCRGWWAAQVELA